MYFTGLLPGARGSESGMHAAVISRNLQQQRVIIQSMFFFTLTDYLVYTYYLVVAFLSTYGLMFRPSIF